jgi:hypothetical protein
MNEQCPEFLKLKDIIIKKKSNIYDLEKNLRLIKSELKEQINQLQKICNHSYVRECTTSGCYAEYHYICKYCDYWK